MTFSVAEVQWWHLQWLRQQQHFQCKDFDVFAQTIMFLKSLRCECSNPRRIQLNSYTLWFSVKERISFQSRGHSEFFSIFKLKSNSWRCHMTHFVQDVQRTSKVNFHLVGDKMMSRAPEPKQDWNEMRHSSVLCDICADPAWLTTGSAAFSLSTDSATVTSRGEGWKCGAAVQVDFCEQWQWQGVTAGS